LHSQCARSLHGQQLGVGHRLHRGGLRGQQLTYALQVRNYDVGCSASSFVVAAAMPNAVKQIDLYMDDDTNLVLSTACDDITYICQLTYNWSVGARGQHAATFKSTDWTGHVGVMTVTFFVG
jgi:hypothetical protein